MAYKGNSIKFLRGSLPRSCKRPKRLRVALNESAHNRPSRTATHISNLPDDVLLQIFSYFTTNELFYTLRTVCKRWKNLAMSPTLWREINVTPEIPTDILVDWIKSAPLLNSFTMKNRSDTNVITEQLSRNCKHLESIKVERCRGSIKNYLIHSTPICNLVTRCPKLYHFNFSKSRFLSKKFFQLISRDKKNGKVTKKCSYVGPMTAKQLMALLMALKNYHVHDTAAIGNVNLEQKFKLDLEELRGRLTVNDIWNYLNHGERRS